MRATMLLHLLFLFLLLGEPVAGWAAYRRFRRRVAQNGALRVRQYAFTVATMWALVAVLLAGAAAAGLSAGDIGLVSERRIVVIGLGDAFPRALGLLLLAAGLVGTLVPLVRVRMNADYRARVETALLKLQPLLPTTASQRNLWVVLSLSAGFTEELLYRGFLFYYLSQVLSVGNLSVLLLGSALVFGLAHAYQGVRGVLGAGALGLVLGALYALTGSILAPAVLHAVMDLRVLWLVPQRAQPAV